MTDSAAAPPSAAVDLLIFSRDAEGRPCAVIRFGETCAPIYYRLTPRQIVHRMQDLAELLAEVHRDG